MKKHSIASPAALTGLVLCFVASPAWNQTRELGSTGQLLDGVAALVDDGIVLKSEVTDRLQNVVASFRQQQMQLPPEQRTQQLPPVSVLEGQVLDQLIIEQIQLQRAKKLGIEIGDDMLNEVLGRVAAGLGLTLDDLPRELASENIDYNVFREQQRQELVMNQLERNDVMSRITITPRELEQCLARSEATKTDAYDYNISHILISFSPDATPDEIDAAEERIRDIEAAIDAGTDFAQLALSYSESQTALQGGALGWRKGSELPTMFADIVPKMEVGEHSDPIRTASGFHIVKLNDMRGAERVVVDQVLARHILIAPNEVMDDDATRQRLLGIRNQILGGEDFETVASAVSEDSASAAEGGSLGWVDPNDFVAEFRDKLNSLEVGELSEPFHTQFGWHIAEVLDRRSYDTTEDKREEDCRNEIGNGKLQEERELWLRRLRDQAYIVKHL